MVHYRTFLAVLSAAAAVSAVPVRRTDSYDQSMSSNYDSSKSGYDSSKSYDDSSKSSYDNSKSYDSSKSYDDSKSSYDNSKSNYDNSNNYDNSKNYDKTTEKMMDSTTEKMMESTTEKMMESTSSMMSESTSTYEKSTAESTSTSSSSTAEYTSSSYYGSGSWDKSGYNDCVSKCMAQFGGGSGGTYQGGSSGGSAGSAGSVGEGATHTVVVAPSQGVLRYVPPFIDASVGDTIMFKWGANNHTVTKGSALLPCNKTSDALFASGTQSKDFTFTQRVNDTSATYFYCATPGHCQKGMFGIINPAKSNGSSSSAGTWMNNTYGSSSSNSSSSDNSTVSSNMTSYMSYTNTMTQNNAVAANWGSDFDMSALPDWAKESMAGNIMYMRNLIATNPDMIGADGKVAVTDAPLALPNDIGAVNNAASTDSSSTGSASSAAPSASSTEVAGAAAQNNQPNGAGALTSSKFAMGAAVIFATMFLL